jgi:alginate O-acetyltransferase complex protein AlgI
MLFNSFEFLIFFPLVTIIYFLLPQKFQWIHLLISSCVFYMFFIPVYIFILFVTIIIDYFAGIWIEQQSGKRKKYFLVGSIISTCMVLFVFKYFNFFIGNFNEISVLVGWNYSIDLLKMVLPIGLSFHTFQSLSYVIEVYRGNQKAEHHFGIYSLYVMFYPQLVAGPIERPQNILHQFYEKHNFDYFNATNGLKLIVWGLFKKVFIADRLSILVNEVYNDPLSFNGLPLIIATIFFAFQIYCDFSGYSDIAIGSAQVMGFKLMDNFNRPYFSKSISEFWKRWHISLSTWFKDYLYISMGGNRSGYYRHLFNLFITFMVSGFWHGANWTFIAWGSLHGIYLILGFLTQNIRKKVSNNLGITKFKFLDKTLNIFVTFILVAFAWIFFRASSIGDAFYIAAHMFDFRIGDLGKLISDPAFRVTNLYLNHDKEVFLLSIFGIGVLLYIHYVQRHSRMRQMLSEKALWFRWTIYLVVTSSILFFGVFSEAQFIYFQF